MVNKGVLMRKIALVVLFATLVVSFFYSEVKPAPIFSSHMVLQQEKDIVLWGTADPGEKVSVEFNGQNGSAAADDKGKWKLSLKPVKAGGPYTMKINDKTIEDILVGEVWLASGQSNMTFRLANCSNGKEEAKQANFPNIRVFLINDCASNVPKEKVTGKWELCSPAMAGIFTGLPFTTRKSFIKT